MQKTRKLESYLEKLGPCAIAYSGGLDSTFLLFRARQVLGSDVLALTIAAPYTLSRDLKDAELITAELQVEHRVIEMPFLEALRENPSDRCYICKRSAFERMKKEAETCGYGQVLDGTNADDLHDYRPGIRALKELEIASPLAECGITKEDVRKGLSKQGSRMCDKPASTCLMTRMPVGHEVTIEELRRIEKAEEFLIGQGISIVRVRSEGTAARIEAARELRHKFFDEGFMDAVSKEFKQYGYRYVALDLEGYITGNMSRRKE